MIKYAIISFLFFLGLTILNLFILEICKWLGLPFLVALIAIFVIAYYAGSWFGKWLSKKEI